MRRTILAVLACMLAMVAIGVTYKTIKGHSQIQAALKKCAAVVAPHSVYAQGVTVLWSANMESNGDPGPDLGQWYSPSCCASANNGGGIFSSGIASAGPSFDYNHTPGGTYSAMLKIATPSTPTSGTRLFRWLEPQTYPALYYSVWYYFPQVYTPNGTPDAWWNVLQWKSKHCPGGVCSTDSFFVLNVGNRPGTGAMYFYLYNNQTLTSYGQTLRDIPAAQWSHVEAFYQCSGDSTGHITIWQDSVQILDPPSQQTRYVDGDCQWSVDNYSNSLTPTPATIYIDDAAICSGGRCP